MLNNHDLSFINHLAVPEREKGITRTFFSYPAKFLSKLPHGLIKRFSTSDGDLILDPFVGGGTTGLEAMILNRRFIGYDINPFAILLSNVKTTYINPESLYSLLKSVIKINGPKPFKNDILDEGDKYCLGEKISQEINAIYTNLSNLDEVIKNFFLITLLHSVRIVGRRDFERKTNWKNASIIPIFMQKAIKMIHGISELPQFPKYKPVFKLGSNHKINLNNLTVDLIITSPPYKDKDIEYQKIQIQRRTMNMSKRSDIISNVLQQTPKTKKELCWTGKSGKNYWSNNENSLKECYRLLKPNKFTFIWTGFKTREDFEYYETQLTKVGFEIIDKIKVTLSNDRVASGRSTHHGRNTGMLTHDFLFILRK